MRHIFQQMMGKDMRVTLNSDDPAYMNGYIGDVFNAVQEALNLNSTQIYKLCRTAESYKPDGLQSVSN